MFRNTETLDLYKYISSMIKKYKLEKGEKEPYLRIRELYNNQPRKQDEITIFINSIWLSTTNKFNSSYDYNNQ